MRETVKHMTGNRMGHDRWGAQGAPSSPPTHLWGSMQEPQKIDQWVFMRENVSTTHNTTWGQEMHVRGMVKSATDH